MKTNYNQLVNVEQIANSNAYEEISPIIALAKQENLKEAIHDEQRVLLLAIDMQNDFMEGVGTLPVTGSRGDIERLTKWIYHNGAKLSQIICSLDCHSIDQIFHAAWWSDIAGNPPPPFTIISYQDVLDGKWIPSKKRLNRSLDYLKNLEKEGNKQLCIWPYHCLEGSYGAKLESEFTKMVYFHAAARSVTPQFIYKGEDPFTEMYGVIKAEYDSNNFINLPLLNAIKTYDKIYIAGEASSHCVLASIEQIATYYQNDPDITKRITLLSDCMSPITGFAESTKNAFDDLEKKYGIKQQLSAEVQL